MKYNHKAKPHDYGDGVWECFTCGAATTPPGPDMRHADEDAGSPQPLPDPQQPARARPTDPSTSHEAAASVGSLRDTQVDVLNLFRRHGAMTDEQMVAHADTDGVQQSVSGLRTRRSELVGFGYLVDSGERGQTAAGRGSIIWRVNPTAVADFAEPTLV